LRVIAFTCLRVYAIWGRDWRPLILLIPICLLPPMTSMYEAIRYIAIQAGPPYGCVYSYQTPSDVISRQVFASLTAVNIAGSVAVTVAEAILIAMTCYKTYGIKKTSMQTGMRVPLTDILTRDGQLASIILSRFMLDLRGLYTSETPGDSNPGSQTSASLRFRALSSSVLRNLGATSKTELSDPLSPVRGDSSGEAGNASSDGGEDANPLDE
ncbi:hypothetical protein GY45DRAFT_1246214, partial [Cubamyces sp. BRFM 1775]